MAKGMTGYAAAKLEGIALSTIYRATKRIALASKTATKGGRKRQAVVKMGARQSAAVDRALAHMARGMTGYAAAKLEGIALSTIYRAKKRATLAAKAAKGGRKRQSHKS